MEKYDDFALSNKSTMENMSKAYSESLKTSMLNTGDQEQSNRTAQPISNPITSPNNSSNGNARNINNSEEIEQTKNASKSLQNFNNILFLIGLLLIFDGNNFGCGCNNSRFFL